MNKGRVRAAVRGVSEASLRVARGTIVMREPESGLALELDVSQALMVARGVLDWVDGLLEPGAEQPSDAMQDMLVSIAHGVRGELFGGDDD